MLTCDDDINYASSPNGVVMSPLTTCIILSPELWIWELMDECLQKLALCYTPFWVSGPGLFRVLQLGVPVKQLGVAASAHRGLGLSRGRRVSLPCRLRRLAGGDPRPSEESRPPKKASSGILSELVLAIFVHFQTEK